MYTAVLAITIIFIDQLSKLWVRSYFTKVEKLSIIKDYFYLTFVKNRGAAFGILKGQRIFFIIITFLFLLFLFYLYKKELPKNNKNKTAVAFLLGGSISNFIDRFFFHYVIDFIAFDFFNFYQFPVINIADFFIFLGTIILLQQLFRIKDRGV